MSKRRCICLLLTVFLLSLASCSGRIDPDNAYSKHLSICVLGNSYSNDSFSYVPFILKEYGVSCEVHIYYRSNGSLANLYNEWLDGCAVHYFIDTREDDKWRRGAALSASSMLSLLNWDIVSLQQSSRQVCVIESYYPYLQEIIRQISETCAPGYSLAWFMAYNRAENTDRESNLEVQSSIVDSFSFDIVLPVATAIFDCQENPFLAEIGESPYHQLYSLDSIHLQEGLPCYIAALAISQAILDQYFPGESVIGNSIRPTQNWIDSVNGITQNGQSVGVTEENCLLAQKAAVLANKFKFEVIPID